MFFFPSSKWRFIFRSLIQSRHFFLGCSSVSFPLSSLHCFKWAVDDIQLEYHWSQFLIQNTSRSERERDHKQNENKKKYTRMKFFPFDLHKYDYALIVLVIWFHEFTLALKLYERYVDVNKHVCLHCYCSLFISIIINKVVNKECFSLVFFLLYFVKKCNEA